MNKYTAARFSVKDVVVRCALKKHLENTLTYFRHGITNAMSEGFNIRIQSIRSQARGGSVPWQTIARGFSSSARNSR
ncbi:MAG: transposase [Planctomycetes bacterium]|nr:transposase [Planctomycetota bacterium]